MTSAETFLAEKREAAGTGSARAVRRAGLVPGIIYGNNKEPEMISLDPKHLTKEAYSGHFYSKVYNISINGKEQQVIAKDIQLHPVTDQPIHVDFQRVSKGAKLNLFVPIHFINEDKAPGIKRGGVLNVVHHTLELICPVDAIPEGITIDLTGLGANQSITADTLNLPKGVTLAHPERDHTIATLVAASGSASEEEKTEA